MIKLNWGLSVLFVCLFVFYECNTTEDPRPITIQTIDKTMVEPISGLEVWSETGNLKLGNARQII